VRVRLRGDPTAALRSAAGMDAANASTRSACGPQRIRRTLRFIGWPSIPTHSSTRTSTAAAKSLAAHLTGVCAAIERKGEADGINNGVQRWLSRNPALERPAPPKSRGSFTVADLGEELGRDTIGNPTCKNFWIFRVWKVELRARATNYSTHLGRYPQVPLGVR
jgi:hypothetical protein